ncbi:hypothetical protein [Mycolicibacterium hodleri]
MLRALKADDVAAKGIADAHTAALVEAMEYLAAHAGYTRVHNPVTDQKDLVRRRPPRAHPDLDDAGQVHGPWPRSHRGRGHAGPGYKR